MSQIGVSYTPNGGSPVYSFLFSEFVNEGLPRQYTNNASFNFSANGASIITGPSYSQKHIWAISSILPNSEAASFDAMFRAWDSDRAAGRPAAVGIIDETFGATVNSSAVFSTAPTYSKFSHTHMVVSFGLTEA